MGERFDVSVIISTYNRCRLLPSAIESVLAQECDASYELIVVDNNSTDETRRVVESFIEAGAPNLRYIFEGKQGLSHGWNAGIAQARGEIVAFTDDDLCVERNWVDEIKRAFDAHPEVDFVGGRVLPRWPVEPPAWLNSDHWSPLAILDHGPEPFYVNVKKPYPLLNKSFRREVFERIGLFKPDMGRIKDGVGSTEDHDLQLRIWRSGGQGLYVPSIVMVSDVDPERLTKAYHRRWHRGHGRHCAMMGLRDITDPQGCINENLRALTLFGVPSFLYRELVAEGARWLTSKVRRDESEAFKYEGKVQHLLGYIGKRYEQNATVRQHSSVAEVRAFVKSFLARKRARKSWTEVRG